MEWLLDKKRPICPQLCEQLCVKISSGEFLPSEKLPSVRELAVCAGVNPNTVQRSFEELEKKGILYSQRGSGWYVCDDISGAKELLEAVYREKTESFFGEMKGLGLCDREIKAYVKEWRV